MICSCGNERPFLIGNLCEECRADPAKVKKSKKNGKRSRRWGLFVVRLPSGKYLHTGRTGGEIDRCFAYVYRTSTCADNAAKRTGGKVEVL